MRFRRRRYIVNIGFQGKFILGFVIVTLMGSIAATVLFNFFEIKRLEELQWSVFVNVGSAVEVIKPFFVYVNLFTLIFVAVLLAITWIWMMRKMNGPLNGIIKNLERVKAGDFSSTIILRRNDEFRDVAEALNKMLARTRERFAELRSSYEEISQALAELELAHGQGAPVIETEERIIEMIQKLKKKLAQ